MKLSICLATRNGSTRNPPAAFSNLLQQFKELADELVIIVDDTSTDDTFEVAKKFTKKVYFFAHDPLFMEMRRQAFYRCTGDWVFAVDDDDILNSRWTRPTVERLMAARSVTHYWVPVRFLVAKERYLSTAPYIGHFGAMLYRNIESIVVLPTKIHQQVAIAGEPAYLAGLYLNAMDFVWHSRDAREAKLSGYDEVYDDWNTGFDQTRFYLYEDYYFEARRIDDGEPVMIMAPLTDGSARPGISLGLLDCPDTMTAGQTYWLTVRLVNNSDEMLLPQNEFIRWSTLALSYRWSGETAESIRTAFPARIEPRHQHDALVKVKAPELPGTYQLHMNLLEKTDEWHPKSGESNYYDSRAVEVTPLVWPPHIEPHAKPRG